MAKLSRPKYLLLICLALGWFFDFLFWAKPWGISFSIFTIPLVAAGLWFARSQSQAVAHRSLWLLIPILFFASVSAFRTEPFTLLFSRAFTLLTLCILAVSFFGGRWVEYGFFDFINRLIAFVPQGLILLGSPTPQATGKKKTSGFRRALPVLRGLLIAVPLLWFFGLLLSSADPIFSNWMQGLFGFLNFDKAGEYAFRIFYIIVFAVIFGAVYMFALFKSRNEEIHGKDGAVVSPFLGFTEAITVLVSVNLLFAAFVGVQFRYFFGGVVNIVNNPTGLTYAEYARRGFGELVFVAGSSLLLFMALSSVTNRKVNQQKWFSWLGILLFALVSVILVSAFQRLLLYEDAYGFTRVRTLVHVFMIWLGILLLAVVILELFHRRHGFAFASLLAAFGFVASLALLNVDAFIARANIEHRFRGGGGGEILDTDYLGSLSTDAMPTLIEGFNQTKDEADPSFMNGIANAMACNADLNNYYQDRQAWQSWNLSYGQASNLWSAVKADAAFPSVTVENCARFAD